MPKMLTLLMITAAVVATYALTDNPGYAAIAGGITLLGAYFAAVTVLKSAPEVTSDTPVSHPDIIPSILGSGKQRTQVEEIDPDVLAMNDGQCPECRKNSTLLAGPSGGMSQNVLCNHCLTEFNVMFGFGTGALKVDRTGKATESRAAVFGIGRDEYRQIERELYSGER